MLFTYRKQIINYACTNLNVTVLILKIRKCNKCCKNDLSNL